MKKSNFTNLFDSICDIKEKVVKLKSEQLREARTKFFEQNVPNWQLCLLWEYIWDDKSYQEILYIFTSKKLIKRDNNNE